MFNEINFLVTNRCNLLCKHCIHGKIKIYQNLSFEAFREILDKYIGYYGECHTASFSGGEPILNPDFEKILEYTAANFIPINIITNGTLIDKYLPILKKIHVQSICVSLDGIEESHDLIRGKGNFKKAINFINTIKDYVPVVDTIFTVNNINCNHIEGYLQYIKCNNLKFRSKHFNVMLENTHNENLVMSEKENDEANKVFRKNNYRIRIGERITIKDFLFFPLACMMNSLINSLSFKWDGKLIPGCCTLVSEQFKYDNDKMFEENERFIKAREKFIEESQDYVLIFKNSCEFCMYFLKYYNSVKDRIMVNV